MRLLRKAEAYFSWITGKIKNIPLPVHFHIELTNKCNLRCKFCPYREIEFTNFGFMDLKLFEKILREMKEIPEPVKVSLHLGGEPLLHPKFDWFIAKVNEELKKMPMMATNATLLTIDKIKKIKEAGGAWLMIVFSKNKKKFEEWRNGANWERVKENIKNALIHGLKIHLSCFDTAEEDIKELFGESSNLSFSFFRLHNVGGHFAEVIEDEFGLHFERKRYFQCTHPWFGMAIAWDGKVVLCCRDVLHQHILGDIKEQNIEEIWNGEEFQKVRYNLKIRNLDELPLCKTCSRPWEKKNQPLYILRHYIKF